VSSGSMSDSLMIDQSASVFDISTWTGTNLIRLRTDDQTLEPFISFRCCDKVECRRTNTTVTTGTGYGFEFSDKLDPLLVSSRRPTDVLKLIALTRLRQGVLVARLSQLDQ
jgi:hypothetical protein